MVIVVNYQKRKNSELFKRLEEPDSLFLSKTQNYIPIYNRFLALNETNYNSINLNHKWYISSVDCKEDENTYNCHIKNIQNQKVKEREIFFKMAPLLDPYKYLVGKYNVKDPNLFNLPTLNSTNADTHSKFLDMNNSAYVDGLFLFLTNSLIHEYKFINGVDYYGSFLALKNDFKLNIFDDIDYLNDSEFFNKHKNILYTVDDYDHLFKPEEKKLKPIKIEYDSSPELNISLNSFETFDDLFNDTNDTPDVVPDTISELNEITIDALYGNNKDDKVTTLRSNSSCSSNSSHTDDECDELDDNNDTNDTNDTNDNIDDNQDDDSNDWGTDDESSVDDNVEVTIPKFPIQLICMECCEDTFDNLILSNELKPEEWYSAFMQIIMILITYQKTFSFTHNDLHTNNVMYNSTDKKYIYYRYKKKNYRVPTFGRIFKIIDFGRSIYKFNGKIFCSDSYQLGGDAATQYNTEPYFNEQKPRLEPNFSFDLCRLACSIFDYVIDDIKKIDHSDPVKQLIYEWCLDDKGVNLLYKNNGVERYPEFKLYKMISRCVHNHTPQAQLERQGFKVYEFSGDIKVEVFDIDQLPCHV
jgi:hypothetical protein